MYPLRLGTIMGVKDFRIYCSLFHRYLTLVSLSISATIHHSPANPLFSPYLIATHGSQLDIYQSSSIHTHASWPWHLSKRWSHGRLNRGRWFTQVWMHLVWQIPIDFHTIGRLNSKSASSVVTFCFMNAWTQHWNAMKVPYTRQCTDVSRLLIASIGSLLIN